MSDKLSDESAVGAQQRGSRDDGIETEMVLPLHEETIDVSRRRVETGVVQVTTITRQRESLVDETMTHERVEIERRPIGRIVETAPSVREEGDLTIIPVIEEVVIVEKRLLLKEEIYLRKVRVTEQHRETVILRDQEAVITRKSIGAEPAK